MARAGSANLIEAFSAFQEALGNRTFTKRAIPALLELCEIVRSTVSGPRGGDSTRVLAEALLAPSPSPVWALRHRLSVVDPA